MPSSLFQLLVFVATASPGYVFLLTADRRRPPRQQSTFRETVEWFVIGSTSTLASLLVAVLVLLVTKVGSVDDLLFDTKAYTQQHLTAVAIGAFLVYVGACTVSWIAARWAYAATRPFSPLWNGLRRWWRLPQHQTRRSRRTAGWCARNARRLWHDDADDTRRDGVTYVPRTGWEHALRETRARQGHMTIVEATVKGQPEPIVGILQTFTTGMDPVNEREITLLVDSTLPVELPGGRVGGQRGQAVMVLHGGEISTLRAFHMPAYGPPAPPACELSDGSTS